MKFTELENKTKEELNQMLGELRVKLGKMKFELSNKSLKDYSQVKKTRKDIAKILTALNK